MKVFISQPKRKDRLVQAFIDEGADVIDKPWDSDLIVPTVDEELPFIARARSVLEGWAREVMIGSPETIDICRDKAEFYRFCRRNSFLTPITMQDVLVVKPRFGKGSKGVQYLDRSTLVQEFVPHPEYSVDYFADFKGVPQAIVPRRRLKVVNGECVEGRVEIINEIVEVCARLGKALNLIGQNTIQGWYTGNSFILNEVNCRFGGGFWISQSYYNSVRKLIELCS